jgi:hypothetical protein
MDRRTDPVAAAGAWQARQARLPKQLVWTVVAACAAPVVLNLAGVDFGAVIDPSELVQGTTPSPETIVFVLHRILIGSFVHTILEWSAFCVALFTVVFAFTHYRLKRDVTTPIIGTALFCSGMIDAFRTLAADGLVETVLDQESFILFTWAISRTFNVCILIAGTAPFVWTISRRLIDAPERSVRFIVVAGILLALMGYAITRICATAPQLPQTVFPDAIIHRPWDAFPLVLYLFAGGIVLPRFHRKFPSLFSHGLWLSIVPNMVSQTYAAFFSTELYDNGFNVSLYLKIVAYLVPLAGLILDYTRIYGAEVALGATREKLRVARDVQKGLLPEVAPQIDGFDLAGSSLSAEAVGGDYFDYVPISGGRVGIVVADVSGHEIGASILMAKTRAYLRALAQSRDDFVETVSQLNRYLVEDVKSRWFVTMFFARLDPAGASFVYSAAGHPGYLIRSSGEVMTLESTSPPLGVLDDGRLPCGPPTRLEAGDMLLLVTDGLFEAQAPDATPYGLDRTLRVVRESRDRPAAEIVRRLHADVRRFCGDTSPVDDITVVLLKRNPAT